MLTLKYIFAIDFHLYPAFERMCLSLSSGVSLRCLILCWERVCSLSVSLPGCSCLVTAISSPLLPWGCSWGHTGWYLTCSFRIHVHRRNPVSNQDSGAVDSSPISVFLSATTGHLPHGSGGRKAEPHRHCWSSVSTCLQCFQSTSSS